MNTSPVYIDDEEGYSIALPIPHLSPSFLRVVQRREGEEEATQRRAEGYDGVHARDRLGRLGHRPQAATGNSRFARMDST